jgi:NAD(P)-dependent dehydrogenase (short-subunit alcohol dehydrogenase family)
VVTASVAGLVAFPPNPIYTLTKHAVVGFVRALAPTLAAEGITVNAVCPGIVDTPMTLEATGGAGAEAFGVAAIPPAEIAEAVLDLATGEGTGRTLAVPLPGTRVEATGTTFGDLR